MLLSIYSGGYCAFPDCRQFLAFEATDLDAAALVSNIAHIESASDDGPRANAALTAKDRDDYANLVLMCGVHHPLIDKQDSTHSVDDVVDMKRDLESWVRHNRAEYMPRVTFAELQAVCDGISSSSVLASTPIIAVPPADKLHANELGDPSAQLLAIGLGREPLVQEYLERMATNVDPNFPGRLRDGFVGEYESLKSGGLSGDDLFASMYAFARSGVIPSGDAILRMIVESAALAVLAHLFHICDVFEPPDVES